MKEELEEGHFDTQGHYHWKKEKEIKDGWLDNIDWVKVKGRPHNKYKVHKDEELKGLGDESSSEDEQTEEKFNLIENYNEILEHMKPTETIAKAIQRLGKFFISNYLLYKTSFNNIQHVSEELFVLVFKDYFEH